MSHSAHTLDPDKHASHVRALIEIIVIAIIAIIVAISIRIFLLQIFYIPSPSMEPYLKVNDKIVVNKMAYKFHDIERGDIVVFKKPPQIVDVKIKVLVKRVIALPGETVEGRCNENQEKCRVEIYINNKKLNEPYLEDDLVYAPFDKITVSANSVFLMGDNRDNSEDGRYFGPTPEDKVIGRAFFKIWPISNFGFL